MRSLQDGFGYNERLFSGGFRKRLHTARFAWLTRNLRELDCPCQSVIELGCFDGKVLDFLPAKPLRYAGFDANWEGGLDLARQRWSSKPRYSFEQVLQAADMSLGEKDVFDVAIIMETLEHIPPHLVDDYLAKIARHLKGYLFVTVPNEKGLVFLAKWLTKRFLAKDAEHYSASELVNATLGRMRHVARNEHKGFDYAALVDQIKRHFDIVEVSGHPLAWLPAPLCFGIGIVARSKGLAFPAATVAAAP